MTRAARPIVLVVLLAGMGASIAALAAGPGGLPGWMPQQAGRFVLRLLTTAMGVAAWFLSQGLLGRRPLRDGRIGDAAHEVTASLNAWFRRRPAAANRLLAVSSGLIDLCGLFLIGAALFGPTLRPGIALLLVFGIRQVSQSVCALPAPPGMIWRDPGVPSLFVTYDVANDFFFSGHTAIAVLGAIEVARVAPWWVASIAAAVALFEAATVLVLRAHYTMDVLMAMVAAGGAAALAATITMGF